MGLQELVVNLHTINKMADRRKDSKKKFLGSPLRRSQERSDSEDEGRFSRRSRSRRPSVSPVRSRSPYRRRDRSAEGPKRRIRPDARQFSSFLKQVVESRDSADNELRQKADAKLSAIEFKEIYGKNTDDKEED